ncbi:MAG TPA: ATP-dependent DNA ligase [Candidatus Nanoarchaeia archaeon]|nr:ATP-dependent DNA ligase [Candidatus Nanoarchaeia archaeon]
MEYSRLVEVYEELNKTTKRLEKTHIISEFLKDVGVEDAEHVTLLLEGRVFPNYDPREIGIAARTMLKSLSAATGIAVDKIENEWKKQGDLGLVAEIIVRTKKQSTLQSTKLTVKKVFENIRKLAELQGEGTVERKVQLIAELITSAKPLESRYIVKTVLDEMRIGVGEGVMRDSIIWSSFGNEIGIKYVREGNEIDIGDREKYNKYADTVQRAYDLTNEFAEVAKAAKKGLKELENIEMKVGIPIQVMLSLKVDTVEEGFETVGKPCAVEFKYDGFRIQAHKDEKGNIKLFTRRLENVTNQFPDVAEYAKSNVKAKTFIIDSEAVGFDKKTGKYLPFQSISQRIKRKYDIEKMSEDFPVELNVFDLIYYDGKNMISEPFEKRRKILEKIIKQQPKKIVLSKQKIVSDEKVVEQFFKDAFNAGNEGLMFKALNAPYKPGARVGHMVKFKAIMETLDLVIVAAEWGEGKRSKWLSSYTIACLDEDSNFVEVGKASTGLKEKEEEGLSFMEMTKLLRPLIVSEKGREVRVKPKLVIEVGYEEIQKSPTYASGYALRFPRVIGLRTMDKGPEEASTIDYVKKLFEGQKKR